MSIYIYTYISIYIYTRTYKYTYAYNISALMRAIGYDAGEKYFNFIISQLSVNK